jgi:hypothetical protein
MKWSLCCPYQFILSVFYSSRVHIYICTHIYVLRQSLYDIIKINNQILSSFFLIIHPSIQEKCNEKTINRCLNHSCVGKSIDVFSSLCTLVLKLGKSKRYTGWGVRNDLSFILSTTSFHLFLTTEDLVWWHEFQFYFNYLNYNWIPVIHGFSLYIRKMYYHIQSLNSICAEKESLVFPRVKTTNHYLRFYKSHPRKKFNRHIENLKKFRYQMKKNS